jgi:hypothetical protein
MPFCPTVIWESSWKASFSSLPFTQLGLAVHTRAYCFVLFVCENWAPMPMEFWNSVRPYQIRRIE